MIVMVVFISVEKSGENHKREFTEHITRGGGRGKPFLPLKVYPIVTCDHFMGLTYTILFNQLIWSKQMNLPRSPYHSVAYILISTTIRELYHVGTPEQLMKQWFIHLLILLKGRNRVSLQYILTEVCNFKI